MAEPFRLRLLQPEDHAQAIDLMHQLHISVGGLVSRALYRALCRSSSDICCVVARQGQDLAGIALVERNRNWIRRRPLLAARMILTRLQRKNRSSDSSRPHPSAEPALPLGKNPPVAWGDGSPRVLFIGVHPASRGRGVGKLLYNAMFDHIRSLGSPWLLARIAPDNVPSLHLHKETGWMLYEGDEVVLAVKDLRAAPSSM